MPALTSSKRVRLGEVKIKGTKPKTADEIKAEFDRLEFDLLENHKRQMADLCRDFYEALENLRRQRMAELAGLEAGTDEQAQNGS